MAFILSATSVAGEQAFPVTSTVDESSIAGRPVALDSGKKLLPWPMPEETRIFVFLLFSLAMDNCLGPVQSPKAALFLLLFRF